MFLFKIPKPVLVMLPETPIWSSKGVCVVQFATLPLPTVVCQIVSVVFVEADRLNRTVVPFL
jgi:hypothetical protein